MRRCVTATTEHVTPAVVMVNKLIKERLFGSKNHQINEK